jgi:hypothetical protein
MKRLEPEISPAPTPAAPDTPAAAGTAAATGIPDRRRGPRRADPPADELPVERRKGDRRRRAPGLPALLGAILADDEDAAGEEPAPATTP